MVGRGHELGELTEESLRENKEAKQQQCQTGGKWESRQYMLERARQP